jgi:hypothetical protein
MGYLKQASCSIANCNQFTISFWVKILQPAWDATNYILAGQWGYPSQYYTPELIHTYYPLDESHIQLGPDYLRIRIAGTVFSRSAWYPNLPENKPPNNFLSSADAQNMATANFEYPGIFSLGNWHHVMIAWDASQSSEALVGFYPSGGGPAWSIPLAWNTLKVAVDGTLRTENGGHDDSSTGDQLFYGFPPTACGPGSGGALRNVPPVTSAPRTAHMPWPFAWDHIGQDGNSQFVNNVGQINCFWQDTQPLICNPLIIPTVSSFTTTLPSWDVKLNGKEFGFPARSEEADLGYTGEAHFAEVKMWFGTYIDPAIHLSKFISGTGRPVDPTAAIFAFGIPDFHFRRKTASGIQFSTNLGSAGIMTQVGTMSDYPGP